MTMFERQRENNGPRFHLSTSTDDLFLFDIYDMEHAAVDGIEIKELTINRLVDIIDS